MILHRFKCPHCRGGVEVLKKDIRCTIFRHGTYINGSQMNPHEKKIKCDKLACHEMIYGCGRPFKLHIMRNDVIVIAKCGYI